MHQDVAGVDSGIDAHGGDAGDGFSLGDCPLDRRRAPVLRQQRGVQVEISKTREIEHPLRDDAAVADDNDRVRVESRKLLPEFVVVFDFVGLRDWKFQADGCVFYGGDCQIHSAAAWTVRLRDDQRHGVAGLYQLLEGWDGKARGAAEDQEHRSRVTGHRSSKSTLKRDEAGCAEP